MLVSTPLSRWASPVGIFEANTTSPTLVVPFLAPVGISAKYHQPHTGVLFPACAVKYNIFKHLWARQSPGHHGSPTVARPDGKTKTRKNSAGGANIRFSIPSSCGEPHPPGCRESGSFPHTLPSLKRVPVGLVKNSGLKNGGARRRGKIKQDRIDPI